MTQAGSTLWSGKTRDFGDLPPVPDPAPRRAWLAQTLAQALGLGAGWAGVGLSGCALHQPGTAPGATPATPLAAVDVATAAPAARVLPFSTGDLGSAPRGWLPYAVRRDLTRTRYAVVRDGNQREIGRAHV